MSTAPDDPQPFPDEELEDATVVAERGRQMVAGSMMQIRMGRALDALLDVETYCDNPRCAVRTITLYVKDYDSTLLTTLEPHGGLLCPVCLRPTVLQTVKPARLAGRAIVRDGSTPGRTR